jgi:hypothetical protein
VTFTPAQEWRTTAQIAESGLPDLPATRQGVDLLADRLKWRQTRFARRRAGKGGGWEYSWKLFPNAARRALIKQAVAPKAAAGRARDEVWAWYEALPQTVKAKAEARLLVIQQVEALEPAIGRFLAVDQVATMNGAGARTIWSWFQMIEGIAAHDRLAYLAPRNRAAEKRPRAKECSPKFFEVLKSDYRTNMRVSYAAGRMAQLVEGGFPLWVCHRSRVDIRPAFQIGADHRLCTCPPATVRRHGRPGYPAAEVWPAKPDRGSGPRRNRCLPGLHQHFDVERLFGQDHDADQDEVGSADFTPVICSRRAGGPSGPGLAIQGHRAQIRRDETDPRPGKASAGALGQ